MRARQVLLYIVTLDVWSDLIGCCSIVIKSLLIWLCDHIEQWAADTLSVATICYSPELRNLLSHYVNINIMSTWTTVYT